MNITFQDVASLANHLPHLPFHSSQAHPLPTSFCFTHQLPFFIESEFHSTKIASCTQIIPLMGYLLRVLPERQVRLKWRSRCVQLSRFLLLHTDGFTFGFRPVKTCPMIWYVMNTAYFQTATKLHCMTTLLVFQRVSTFLDRSSKHSCMTTEASPISCPSKYQGL